VEGQGRASNLQNGRKDAPSSGCRRNRRTSLRQAWDEEASRRLLPRGRRWRTEPQLLREDTAIKGGGVREASRGGGGAKCFYLAVSRRSGGGRRTAKTERPKENLDGRRGGRDQKCPPSVHASSILRKAVIGWPVRKPKTVPQESPILKKKRKEPFGPAHGKGQTR